MTEDIARNDFFREVAARVVPPTKVSRSVDSFGLDCSQGQGSSIKGPDGSTYNYCLKDGVTLVVTRRCAPGFTLVTEAMPVINNRQTRNDPALNRPPREFCIPESVTDGESSPIFGDGNVIHLEKGN